NGCSASASDMVEVFALPMVTFTALADLCIDAGVQMNLGSGSPTGGTYSGPGVTDDGNGMTYSFDPSSAGIGVHTITYMFTDVNGCSASASDMVEVFALPNVSLVTTDLGYCFDSPIGGTLLTGGTPEGGVYSGPGISDNSLGTGYFFDPMVAGVGVHQVTYTFTDGNGCVNAAMSNIEVFDCDVDITDPCSCLDNATTLDVNLGTGGDDGQFSELITISNNNGTLPMGQTWTVVAATGAFDAYNVPAVGTPSAGVPVATDGSVTLTFNAGAYELPFVHVDAMGYSITIEGPAPMGDPGNSTQTIGNNCSYPNPAFDPPLPDVFCPADMPITLMGTDADGIGGTPSFTINGMSTTVIDPATLTPGLYAIEMSFVGNADMNGGIAPMGGTAFPGCTQDIRDTIEILAGSPPTIVCPADNLGLPMGCNVTPPAGTTMFNLDGDPNPDPALPTVTGGCGTLTLTFSDATADVGCIRTLTRTYTITDQVNDSDMCTQTFTWTVDTTPPTFDNPPMDATVECSAIPAPEMVTATDNCVSLSPVLFINEIDYDNTGGDVGEFVEIAGTAGIDLSLYEVYAYEGSDGFFDAQVSLSGVIPNESMGFGAVSFTRTELPTGFFENGPNDGIALVEIATGIVIDFISYEGTVTANNGPATGMTSTDIGTEPGDDPVGQSLQLSGTGCDAMSFTWSGPSTASPGMLNAGQTFDPAACMSSSAAMVSFMEVRTPSPTCPQEGTLTRTWTATDACGNTAQTTQVLTIVDTTPPVICDAPGDITISCDVAIPTPPVVTAFDNCDFTGIGNIVWVNEFHYDNTGGDVGEFIEVAGIAGTDLTGYSLALYNGANGLLDETIDLSGTIPAETCGFGALSFPAVGLMNGSPDGFALVQDGTVLEFLSYEGTFTAMDGPAMGMMSTDVGVSEPGTTPVGQSLQLTGSGSGSMAFTWTGPAAESPGMLNVGQTLLGNLTATLTETMVPGTCPQEMTITRTWNVMDACGNPAVAAVQVISVVDNAGPVVTCPPTMTGLLCNTDLPVVSNIAGFIGMGGTASDNCGTDFTVSYIDNPSSPAFLNYCPTAPATERTITRTYTITDECGNVSNCSQDFVFDPSTTGPVITAVPPDRTVDCSFNVMSELHLFDAETDCNLGLTRTVSDMAVINGTPNCPNTTYQFTYTATDECGRVAQHIQTYTIQNDGPQIVCPNEICIIECPEDESMILAAFAAYAENATVVTSCNGIGTTITDDFNPNGFFNQNCASGPVNGLDNVVKWQNVTFTATDPCGRTSTCTALVVVTDNQGPTIEGEPYLTIRECDDLVQSEYDAWIADNLANLTATDGCSDVEWTYTPLSPNEGPWINGYAITHVTFIATDQCGNSSTKDVHFKLKNKFPPSWVGDLIDKTAECSDPMPSFDTPQFANACGTTTLTFEDVTIPGACPNEFSIVRTWTVTDNCEGTNTTAQTISIVDTTAPEAPAAPADLIVECEGDVPASMPLTAVDNCDGDITVSPTEMIMPGACDNQFIVVRT
ncbi:MAG: lamin tail domain-containing protein, partial [Bacteroidota bacterium]